MTYEEYKLHASKAYITRRDLDKQWKQQISDNGGEEE